MGDDDANGAERTEPPFRAGTSELDRMAPEPSPKTEGDSARSAAAVRSVRARGRGGLGGAARRHVKVGRRRRCKLCHQLRHEDECANACLYCIEKLQAFKVQVLRETEERYTNHHHHDPNEPRADEPTAPAVLRMSVVKAPVASSLKKHGIRERFFDWQDWLMRFFES